MACILTTVLYPAVGEAMHKSFLNNTKGGVNLVHFGCFLLLQYK